LGSQSDLERLRILGDLGFAERGEHAIERAQRHAVSGGDALDLFALGIGQACNRQQQFAAFAGDDAVFASRQLLWCAEVKLFAQALVHPGALPGIGLEIDLFRHHAHDEAKFAAGHGGEVTQNRRSIRTVAPGFAIERGQSWFGGKTDDGADRVGCPLFDCRKSARRTEARAAHLDLFSLLAGHRAGRKRIGAAGIDQKDGEVHLGAQFIQNPAQGHQVFFHVFKSAKIGINRNKPVFPARLDSMAGIINDRGIRALGVFGKAVEIAAQLLGIAIGRTRHVKPELFQQVLDRAGITLGIRQG